MPNGNLRATGLDYGVSVVTVTEIVRPPDVATLPLRRRIRIHATVLALGLVVWPVGLVQDLRGGR